MVKYRYSIAMLLSFVLLENIAWIIEPTFFGKLLDALIGHFYDHEKVNYMLPLLIWIFVYFLNVVGGGLHRLCTGKVYSKMYADVATKVIEESETRGDKYSKMLVRSELVKEYITFFKDRLPEALWQLSASVGAVIALFFYDYRIGIVCLAVIIPVAYVNNFNRQRVAVLQKDIHDNQEELYKLIENRDTSKIHMFFTNMISPRTRISRWNAFSYSTVKVLLIIIFIVVLFICVDVDNFSTGKIYSVVAYLWTFIGQTDYLPDLMESLGSIKDLNTRFTNDNKSRSEV
ncbi:MAG: ABC transporter six-transmembrane domain-containing protein [Bacteroidales bacterium]|jgi:ABC-type multidrug transport system fused ATPase/permease subunit